MTEDYTLGDIIFASGATVIQLCQHKQDGRQLVMKKPAETAQALLSVESFKKDYQFTSMLHKAFPDNFINMVEMLEQKNGSVYLVEELEGVSLQKSVQTAGPYDVKKFLKTAKKMTEGVHMAHSKQIFHRDIKLGNFMLNQNGKVKLIDFGTSVTVTRKSPSVTCSSPTGTLGYMSPEQTGRISKNADFRSDIYSLGISFYELLTGELPFKGDKLEIVHAHISKKLPALTNVPEIINRIVQKMCSKSPSERYFSAFGLLKDLEYVSENISNLPENFELASQDIQSFQIPNKLYGRENELLELKKSIMDPKNSMLLVSGPSGMGKSKLVEELLKDQNMALLITYGKFDQFNRLTPYSAFISTMISLVNKILSEDNQTRTNFSEILKLDLGEKCSSVLCSIIPEISALIGTFNPPEILATTKETQERLFESFLKFYNAFTVENTLILVLDDLQWCDAASFQLLESLISLKNKKIFIIGAYRDNEVGPTHPLMNIINDHKSIISTINLHPLKLEHLNEMVAETLNTKQEETQKLSELIYKKTNGNPFFSREFINTLYQEELLVYENGWKWDIERVEKMNFSSNVIDFMIKNLKKKSNNMQKLLNRAACIGNTFKVEELKWIWDEKTSVEEELVEPVAEGWIFQINSNEYQFYHDRLQQSSYELFDEKEIQKIHLAIGTILLDEFTKQNTIEQHIFKIINHLNIAKSIFQDEIQLLELNLIASKKSLENSAFAASLKFSTFAVELLPADAWKTHYDLAFRTNSIHANTCYANSVLDQSEKYFNLVLENANGRLDKLKVISEFIKMLSLTNEKRKAYNLLILVYKMFDLTKDIPFDDTQGALDWTLDLKKKTELEIQQIGGIYKILDLKYSNDPEFVLFVTIMCEAVDVLVLAKEANPILVITNSLIPLYLYLTVGLAHNAPVAISLVGWIYSFFFMEPSCYKYTRVAETLLSRDKHPKYNVVSVHNALGLGYITGGTVKEILFHSETAARLGPINGEFIFGAYASLHSSTVATCNGENYEKLIQKVTKRKNWLIEIKNTFNADFVEIIINYLSDLCGISDYNPKLTIENFITFKHANSFKPTYEGMLEFHKGNYDTALKIFEDVEPVGDTAKGLPDFYERKFYHCLLLILDNKKKKSSTTEERIKKYLDEWKLYATLGPDYLAPRCKLLDLIFESTKENANKMKIMNSLEELYDKSNENGLLILAAVTSEFILQYCDENGFPKGICKMYYSHCYNIWSSLSAKRKEDQLRKKYFKYSMTTTRRDSDTIMSTTKSDNSTTSNTQYNHESMDMISIIKASQALSVELTTSTLISKVLSIIIENTGAQNGLLFLVDGKSEFLEISMKNGKTTLFHRAIESFKENETFCSLLLSLAKSVKKTVVINDVPNSQYSEHKYLKSEHVKSICVHPIIKGKKYIGSIYLEHFSLEGAFDESRKEILGHISSQLAISYENAKLYEDMNSLNKSYERFLPKEFLEQIGKGDVRNIKKGDASSKKIAVLFSDIRSFTDLTEKMNPEESFSFVNGILSYLAPIISKHHGFIDKFFGDCIMALFPYHVDDSINCGLEMLVALETYNKECRKGLQPVQIGIGIHYGNVMLGTIGSEDRIDATVISDTVNTASRVESLTKTLGATFVVTESVIQHSTANCKYRYIGKYLLKGKEQSVGLYHILDENSEVNVEQFTEAIQHFESGRFKESEKIFASLNDNTSKYLEKVADYFGNFSFDSSWSGEIKIDKDGNVEKLDNLMVFGETIQKLEKEQLKEILDGLSKSDGGRDLLNSWSNNNPKVAREMLEKYK